MPSSAGLPLLRGIGAAGDMSSMSAYFATVFRLTWSIRAISDLERPAASIDRISFTVSRGTVISSILPGRARQSNRPGKPYGEGRAPGPRSAALLLKLLNFSCSRCLFPSDHSDHFLVNINTVYTGFENGYATATVGNDGKTTAPWWPNRNNIVAVKAIDDGIEIHSLAFCFQYMENCKSFDLAKFDMSNCTNLQHAFAYCGNATSFSISSWDTSSVVEFDSALKNLYKVEEIDISGWSTRKAGDLRLLFSIDSSLKSLKFGPGWKTSDVMDMLGMFSYCKNLNLDCSDWNVPTYANHSDFNHCAPGVILPKAWQ